MQKISKFVDEIKQECNTISWPAFKETTNATIVILITVILASLSFASIDYIVYYLINLFITF